MERRTEDVVMRTWKWVDTKDRKTETEAEPCYMKIHEGERRKDRSTRPENVDMKTRYTDHK